MNKTVKNFINNYQQIDKEFLELQNDICHKEAEKYFDKYYWGLTISRCSEEEFIKWWNENKNIPYNSYFYKIACYVWDIEQAQHD